MAEASPAARPRRPSVRLLVLLAGGLILAALAVVLAAGAWNLAAARDAGERARSALAAGDLDESRQAAAAAGRRFGRADRWLHNPLARAAGWVPVAGRNVRAAAAMARSGTLLSDGVAEVLDAASSLPGGVAAFKPEGGAIPLEPLDTLAAPLASAAAAADEAAATLAASPDRWLLPPVAAARHELGQAVAEGRRSLGIGAALTEAVPAFLGGDGPRRYFLAAGNPAELRGAGGFLGAYTIMTADRGSVTLAEFSSIHEIAEGPPVDAPAEFTRRYGDWFTLSPWLNTNLSPHFPTAATLIERLYLQETGQPLDGVIVADPFALQALLELRDPLEVPGVGLVGGHNVVEVVANRAYDLIESEDERKLVLGSIAVAGIENLLSGAVESEAAMAALARAAADGHLLLHATESHVQEAFEAAGVAGAFGHAEGDFLAVVGNNGAQNKADYYTERTIRYRVELHPEGLIGAGLGVRLTNHTPTEGLRARVIGPNLDLLEAGDNLMHLNVYCADCALDDHEGPTPQLLETDQELGYTVFSLPVHLSSGQTRDLTWSWTKDAGWDGDAAGGTYRLAVHNQPTIVPNRIHVEVVPPAGMAVTRTVPDMTVDEEGTAVFERETRGPVTIEVRVEPPATQRAWLAVRDVLRRPVIRLRPGEEPAAGKSVLNDGRPEPTTLPTPQTFG